MFESVIESLARRPGEVAGLLRDLSEQSLRVKKSAEEFSALENICHLRDIEVEGYGPRIERILTEDCPVLRDIDGGKLAIQRAYNEQEIDSALGAFALARSRSVAALRQVRQEQF